MGGSWYGPFTDHVFLHHVFSVSESATIIFLANLFNAVLFILFLWLCVYSSTTVENVCSIRIAGGPWFYVNLNMSHSPALTAAYSHHCHALELGLGDTETDCCVRGYRKHGCTIFRNVLFYDLKKCMNIGLQKCSSYLMGFSRQLQLCSWLNA